MTYNLLTEGWIPVLFRDGRFERVGIRSALTQAGHIRQIAASNPLDNVALLRFLLALLMWCRKDLKSALEALEQNNPSVPENWLAKLDQKRQTFDLLGNGPRFYQDDSVKGKGVRPIGDLLVEFPTETKIAHFRHVRDKEYGLCSACCALGITRFCTWANAYAGGKYTSAVNGPAPAYAIPLGVTLLDTLRRNRPLKKALNGPPPWERTSPPSAEDLDLVTVLGWRSRKLWLDDPSERGQCAHCGEHVNLIRQLWFTGNWPPPFPTLGQKKFWDQDPHLIIVEKRSGSAPDDPEQHPEEVRSKMGGSRAAGKTTLGFPLPGAKIATHVGFWRRAQKAYEVSKGFPIMVAGPAANKGLYQDAHILRLAPRDGAAQAVEAQEIVMKNMSEVLRRATPNPKRRHPNRTAALDALSPSIEDRLRRVQEETPPRSLMDCLGPAVEQVVRCTTPGSLLRRREALLQAQSNLEEALRKATAWQTQAPSGARDLPPAPERPAATKTKLTRKKKGDAS